MAAAIPYIPMIMSFVGSMMMSSGGGNDSPRYPDPVPAPEPPKVDTGPTEEELAAKAKQDEANAAIQDSEVNKIRMLRRKRGLKDTLLNKQLLDNEDLASQGGV